MSSEGTAICVVDEAGRIVRDARTVSEPEALVELFRASWMQMDRIGLEACSRSAWLHAGLAQAGLPAICIEGHQVKAAMGAMPSRAHDLRDPTGVVAVGLVQPALIDPISVGRLLR